MKVVILAGGYGTRLGEYTDIVPKPMVKVGNRPIIWHIMNHYAHFGHKEFIIALGYKGDVIKDYFLNYKSLNSNFKVNLKDGDVKTYDPPELDWEVTLVDTGEKTMTGGRVKNIKDYIGNESFMLTYGDTLSNVNILELVKYHKENKKMITMTAVRPNARFGELEIKDGIVTEFIEKPQLHDGWINGGFFVIEPEFINFIDGNETFLEKEPIEKAVELKEVMAFQHKGFWQCMDTKREHDLLNTLWDTDSPPWLNF
jgi:glucose-1-phosphate cytidylyltransferase